MNNANTTTPSEPWKQCTVGDLGTFRKGRGIRKSEVLTHGIPCVRYGEIYTVHKSIIQRCQSFIDRRTTKSSERLEYGDVIFAVSGETSEDIGKCSTFVGTYEAYVGSDTLILKPNGVDPIYLGYALNYGEVLKQKQILGQGDAVVHLSLNHLLKVKLLLPPLIEQQAIGAELSQVDIELDSLDALINKKRDIKQGAMQALWINSESWAEVELKRVLLDHFCGPSPTCEERNVKGDEWGVLRTTCATWEDGWNWRSHKLLPRSYWGQDARMVRVGDTIITKAGPRHRVGVPAFVDFIPNNILPSGKMIALRPNPAAIEPYFLTLALRERAVQHFLNERTTGMAESQVNFENRALMSAIIKVPAPCEQKEISIVSRDMDAEIDSLVALREKKVLIKLGMMQELLTGRTRLR